jgi:hypothetical protein
MKSSDSIFNLKEVIFKNLSIPIDKIQIVNSNDVIEDSKLLENFIKNLFFEINLL